MYNTYLNQQAPFPPFVQLLDSPPCWVSTSQSRLHATSRPDWWEFCATWQLQTEKTTTTISPLLSTPEVPRYTRSHFGSLVSIVVRGWPASVRDVLWRFTCDRVSPRPEFGGGQFFFSEYPYLRGDISLYRPQTGGRISNLWGDAENVS